MCAKELHKWLKQTNIKQHQHASYSQSQSWLTHSVTTCATHGWSVTNKTEKTKEICQVLALRQNLLKSLIDYIINKANTQIN